MTLNCCGVMPIKAKIASEAPSEKEENVQWWGERPREPLKRWLFHPRLTARGATRTGQDARPTCPKTDPLRKYGYGPTVIL